MDPLPTGLRATAVLWLCSLPVAALVVGCSSEPPLPATDWSQDQSVVEDEPPSELSGTPLTVVMLDPSGEGDTVAGGQQVVDCEPGELQCGPEGERQVCRDSGDGWKHVSWCSWPYTCNPATAMCEIQVCNPTMVKCSSAQVGLRCNDIGTGWLEEEVLCTVPDRCTTSGCQKPLCLPGATRCSGPQLQVCRGAFEGWESVGDACLGPLFSVSCVNTSEDGGWEGWEVLEAPCSYGSSCIDGACADWVCEPGEARCGGYNSQTIERCSPSGMSWASLGSSVACLGTDQRLSCQGGKLGVAQCLESQTCDDGWCENQVCEPGGWGCNSVGKPRQCLGSGLGWSAPSTGTVCASHTAELECNGPGHAQLDACGDQEACVVGFGCVQQTCEPGLASCTGSGQLTYCDESGLMEVPASCGVYGGCVAGDEAGEPGCDCGGSAGCLALQGCLPLRAGRLPDAVQSLRLRPTFTASSVGPDQGRIVLGPTLDPRTGLALAGLGAAAPPGSQTGVTVVVGGSYVQLDCELVAAESDVPLDMVLLVDTTESMASTHARLAGELVALASTLSVAGFDPSIHALAFADQAPAAGTEPLIAADDGKTLAAVMMSWETLPGGDTAEDALDAVAVALETVPWRDGALRTVLLITDAPMHDVGDGSGLATHSLIEVIDATLGSVAVHVVGGVDGIHPFVGGLHPDPRLLACATGGSAQPLDRFLSDPVETSDVVTALEESIVCTFEAPTGPHAVEVEVQQMLFGELYKGSASGGVVSFE